MSFIRTSLLLTALSFTALAHPMGNFSVNHYSRLHFRQSGVELTYVLDLAEIPTFQLQGEPAKLAQGMGLEAGAHAGRSAGRLAHSIRHAEERPMAPAACRYCGW
jgi:hypothetical protein